MTYDDFIQNIINTRGQWNIPAGEYYEAHHIIPKCLGGLPKNPGKYQKHKNIIWLTAKEHFVAHKLLAAENPNNYSLVTAFFFMSNTNRGNILIDADEYEDLRKQYALLLSNKIGSSNNPFYGKQPSVETREKIRKANTGKPLSAETKQKLSQKHLGQGLGNIYIFHPTFGAKSISKDDLASYLENGWVIGNGQTGKVVSEETKKIISEKTKLGMQKWREENPEEYQKYLQRISETSAGRKLSEEAKQKISFKNSGKNNGMYKDGHSSKAYIEAHRKVRSYIRCIETDEIFKTASDAARKTGAVASHIRRCCKKEYGFKTAGGYHWEFVKIDN